MSLSKQQIAGIGGGCAFLLVAGFLGYMFYDAAAERAIVETGDEESGEPGLSEARETFVGYNRAPVFPSQESIDSVKSNAAQYVAWYANARKMAARGDYAEPAVPEDNSAFKDRLKSEVDRMVKLPGGVNGHIAGADCLFGFEKYLGENGILPDQKDVPLLARQLASIRHVVDVFAAAGVYEVQSIRRLEPAKESDDRNEQRQKPKKGASEASAPSETSLEYAFALRARPTALVKMLNILSADSCFMVVKDFSFRKPDASDMILSSMSAKDSEENKSSASSSGRRRRRLGAAVEQPKLGEEDSSQKRSRLVVDPELDAPFDVTFTLAVYDFGLAPSPLQEGKEAK
jgi:hypothetical protein